MIGNYREVIAADYARFSQFANVAPSALMKQHLLNLMHKAARQRKDVHKFLAAAAEVERARRSFLCRRHQIRTVRSPTCDPHVPDARARHAGPLHRVASAPPFRSIRGLLCADQYH